MSKLGLRENRLVWTLMGFEICSQIFISESVWDFAPVKTNVGKAQSLDRNPCLMWASWLWFFLWGRNSNRHSTDPLFTVSPWQQEGQLQDMVWLFIDWTVCRD